MEFPILFLNLSQKSEVTIKVYNMITTVHILHSQFFVTKKILQCYNKTRNNVSADVEVATGKYTYVSVNASLARGREPQQSAYSFQLRFDYFIQNKNGIFMEIIQSFLSK